MRHFNYLASLAMFFGLAVGCDSTSTSKNIMDNLQERLILAEEGAVLNLPEGTFQFNRPLSLQDVNKVTIKGAGKDKTILSFSGQLEGGEGMIIKNCHSLVLEDFCIADSKGDALKVQGCNGVVMRGLKTTWTQGKLETNGGYGLYPVTCTEVLMENCEASYAMDAGIYVGQSTDVVVRNNVAHNNVAGIEIENTIRADVYGNKLTENTGGLLVFDMPDLPQANGSHIRVHDNIVDNNNGENFSAPGIVVNILPPGSGLIIMAHHTIEVFDNTLTNHNTVSIALNSWQFTGRPFQAEAYDPFCHNISIHGNRVISASKGSDNTTEFGQLISAITEGKGADVLIDGIFNPSHFQADESFQEDQAICLHDNGELIVLNLNAGQALDDKGEIDPAKLAETIEVNPTLFDCQKTELVALNNWLTQ